MLKQTAFIIERNNLTTLFSSNNFKRILLE